MKGLEYRGIDGILTYPVAQKEVHDVDMFEVTGLGAGPVDIEVIAGHAWLDTEMGLFDSNGNLIGHDDDSGFDDLSRLAGVSPDPTGTVRFAITGDEDSFFGGWHEEMGTYQVAVWPSGNPGPNNPAEETESESNNDFLSRNVFAGTDGQILINGSLGDPQFSPEDGDPVIVDWYDELADVILATQNPDGSWPGDAWGESGDSVLTTAWALLTLEKVTPPVAMIYGQCILAGESFEPTNLDEGIDPCNPGTPPYTWTVMGNVALSVDIDANNVMTVTYPQGWTGSETLTLICVDAAQQTYIIPYPNPTYAVCAKPVVMDIPDQAQPFQPFDLDDYLDPQCGLLPTEVQWSVSGVSGGWSVQIDPDHIVTVTAPADANQPATFTFTAASTVCVCAELSDSNDATFAVTGGTLPPDCTGAYADPDCLWPPRHRMVAVNIRGVTDPAGHPVSIVITGITSDEATASARGAGGPGHSPDADGIGNDTAHLRAERSGRGNGRVYQISFVANNAKGAQSQGTVQVTVPRNRRQSKGSPAACEAPDDGQLYDATQTN
jgi:hypothetical protein